MCNCSICTCCFQASADVGLNLPLAVLSSLTVPGLVGLFVDHLHTVSPVVKLASTVHGLVSGWKPG